jgi:hypothetical protein
MRRIVVLGYAADRAVNMSDRFYERQEEKKEEDAKP